MSESKVPQAAGWWHDFDFGTGISIGLDVVELHAEQTQYQMLQVFEHPHLGRVLALDGIIQTTLADEFIYHEMISHVPLMGFARPPRAVLIVGGGDGGVLREVLTHPHVERAVMVEIDERVVEVAAKYLGLQGDYDDPRAELVIGDAAEWVRRAAGGAPFDVVIVDSTDPVGPGEVLFHEKFLSDLSECMSEDGVMVRQAGMPFVQRDELPSAFRDAVGAFGSAEVYSAPVPTYSCGAMAFVAGLKDGRSLREPRDERSGRHYNPDVHRGAFALPTWWRELTETG
ncbi:MAG: polyamine aminopropyltransferase [Deltaproteobacteria bacterium]|nr:polyamine aminopropyltransferase [Deltaproteobacteria bacterium]MBW2413013.1 polyamine aminopropyltransferase [Deltaproteobacteria bacterium]